MKKLLLSFLYLVSTCTPVFAEETIVKADVIEGQISQKNYLGNKGHFEKSAIGWSGYDDGSATPVDGTGGTVTTTCTRTATSPLSGVGSFLYTPAALGEGCSASFTIDAADKGKMLSLTFDYAISSGTYTDDDTQIWIYDVTNAALIQPAPSKIKGHSLTSEKFFMEFQAAYNSTSYRLLIHQATAGTAVLKIDNMKLGPTAKLYGSAVTDWVNYTPTFTGFGTVSAVNVVSRKVGASLEVQGYFTSGTPTATTAQMTLGFGGANGNVVIDTAKAGYTIGTFGLGNASTTLFSGNILSVNGAVNYITFGAQTSTVTANNPANGNLVAVNGGVVSFKFSVPIVGWSSSQLLSSDAATRVNGARYFSSSTGAIPSSNTVFDFSTVSYDKYGSVTTGASWKHTAKVPGLYNIKATMPFIGSAAATRYDISIRKNGSIVKTEYVTTSAAVVDTMRVEDTIDLVAGDYVDIVYMYSGTAGGTLTGTQSIVVSQKQGPSQISASESITASYYTTAGQTINNTNPVILFGTKEYDSAGIYTPATGIMKAPSSGKYRFTTFVRTVSTAWSAGNTLAIFAVPSIGNTKYISFIRAQAGVTQTWETSGSVTLSLLEGETVQIKGYADTASALDASLSSGGNTLFIERVGNY